MTITMEEDLKKALEVLRGGGLILYPTDTIWGIGCDATNDHAVESLFRLKHRPDSKAMISLVDSLCSLKKWVESVPHKALCEIENASRPLTIIYDRPTGISEKLKAEDGSAAFRIPVFSFTRMLCKECGFPLVSSSANVSGKPSPATFREIDEEIINGVDYVCSTGRETSGVRASRILKITDNEKLTIIRE